MLFLLITLQNNTTHLIGLNNNTQRELYSLLNNINVKEIKELEEYDFWRRFRKKQEQEETLNIFKKISERVEKEENIELHK